MSAIYKETAERLRKDVDELLEALRKERYVVKMLTEQILSKINAPAICPDPTGEGSAWQGSLTPAEPAPGSDAEHPPEGYRLEPVGGTRAPGYVWWCPPTDRWQPGQMDMIGKTVYPSVAVANPIPANEGDSQKAGLSDKIAESVVQDLQQACYDRDELRATVERLTAENEELRKTNTSYHMTITDLNDRLRMIREVLR